MLGASPVGWWFLDRQLDQVRIEVSTPRKSTEVCGNCTEGGELKGQNGIRSVGQQLRHANAAETCIHRAVPARNIGDFLSTGEN